MLKKNLSRLSAALILATLAAVIAPGFLARARISHKADAVVLYLGPERESRLDEARRLLSEGHARYLIIPAYGEIYRVQDGGVPELTSRDFRMRGKILLIRKAAHYRNYYENTHVETCEAKRIMDELGLRSALLVSSSYHMRRIGMIAGRVFRGDEYTVSCNPVRWQAPFAAADWFDEERRKIIVSEYVKMAWFLIYGAFT